jgi:hypothetical protein
MYYIFQWLSYFILSGVALGITGLSLLSSINTQHYLIMSLKVLIFLLVSYQVLYEGFKLSNLKVVLKDHYPHFKNNFLVFIYVVLGGIATFFIANQLNLNAVLVSGFVGLVASITFKKYQIPIYCGSFAGMASILIFDHMGWMFLSSIFTGLLFVASQEVFKGFGGKLGATAFLGTFVTALITKNYQDTYLQMEIYIQWEVIIYFILGAVVTNRLHLITKKSTVFTSGMLGVLAGIVLPIVYQENGLSLAAALFSGTFLGMTKIERFEKTRYFLLASIVGGIIFIYSQPYFNGLGGKLGSIAFISSMAMTSLKHLVLSFKKNKEI